MLGGDRVYCFYCAFMSTVVTSGQEQTAFLVHFLIWENQRHYVRWRNDVVCACVDVLKSPLLVYCKQNRTYSDMWTLIFGALTLLISVLILFSVCALAFFLFFFSISFSVTTSECPGSPLLPRSFLLPLSRPLIFLFPPVNINTGLMCTPAQMFALEELTAHIVGHGHHVSPYLLRILGPFLTHSAHEKVTDKALSFFYFLRIAAHDDIWHALLDKKVWGEVLHMTHRCELCDILNTPRYVNINEVFC